MQQKILKLEKSYFGITIMIAFVRIVGALLYFVGIWIQEVL
jgi:uncharacterized membrane protein YiaA